MNIASFVKQHTILEQIGRLLPSQSHDANRVFHVSNLTRGTVIGNGIEVADRGGRRRKGLLGRSALARGEGLWIAPCEAIHTFFMRFDLDLVYLGRERNVIKVRSGVRPWRISGCLIAHSVLELPAGTVNATRTQKGDLLAIVESVAPLTRA
jgi:uncharacterized membrane protein (UPF0127 family)